MAKPIPNGYHTVTPSFMFKDSKKAIDFYKEAFGAKVLDAFPHPSGQGIMHATLQIGDSIVMMGDENPAAENCGKSAETLGSSPISLYVYVPNVDAAFNRAVAAGAGLYAIDGLIVLAAHDWVAVAIHTAALALMVRGLDAARRGA